MIECKHLQLSKWTILILIPEQVNWVATRLWFGNLYSYKFRVFGYIIFEFNVQLKFIQI